MSKHEPINIERNVPIVITSQAQAVLSQTNFSVEEFVEWALFKNKISFGGHNVTQFLEVKSREVDE